MQEKEKRSLHKVYYELKVTKIITRTHPHTHVCNYNNQQVSYQFFR